MNFQSLSRQEIRDMINNSENPAFGIEQIRMLFVPNKISTANFNDLLPVYKSIAGSNYDTVVVIESYTGHLDKKLAMPAHKSFESRFGEVQANDFLRNEFCDEEDDFYISDEGFSTEMSLFTQLPILQACLQDFDVLSLQIGDYDPAIVRELAHAIDELLQNRNALIVFCCDVPTTNAEEIESVKLMITQNNESKLQHYLNSSEKQVKGARAFMSGVLVAQAWDLDIEFLDYTEGAQHISGFARQRQNQFA